MSFNIAIDRTGRSRKKHYSKTACKGTFFYICRYRSHVSEYGIVFYEKWHCKGR